MFEPLYQNDPRWKGTVLGNGSSETIGDFGCLLTSMAMVVNYFGGNETVASFNEKMKQKGAFQNQWVRPAMISSAFSSIKYLKRIDCSGKRAPMNEIDATLTAGSLAVVMVDRSPNPGVQGHWVVVHEKQGNDYAIWDPWKAEGASNTLAGRYPHGAASDIIQDIILFGGPPSQASEKTAPKAEPAQPPSPTPPAPASKKPADASGPVVVQPLADKLKMRRQPKIAASNIVKQLAVSARLTALDPAKAQTQIGVHGEWMHARDAEGDEGYVAAWYVTPVENPAMGVRKAPQAEALAAKLTVKTTTEDVALRTRPQVSDATLIERLPFPTELQVIESGDAASKIGVRGQWLQVQSPDGKEGYVAAWYVSK